MELKPTYPAKANSPITRLAETISSTDEDIRVEYTHVFPDAPNIAVLGVDKDRAEGVRYKEIDRENNVLIGCERGFEGDAQEWPSKTLMARNFTAYDHDTHSDNILALNQNKISKIENPTEGNTVIQTAEGDLQDGGILDLGMSEEEEEQLWLNQASISSGKFKDSGIVIFGKLDDGVNTDDLRQTNASVNSASIGATSDGKPRPSQINSSIGCTASGHYSQINASDGSQAKGDYSQVNSSTGCEASGVYSRVNTSFRSKAKSNYSESNASSHSDAEGNNSQINASSRSKTTKDRSQVNASTYSTAGGIESQINASRNSEATGPMSQINNSDTCKTTAFSSQINASKYVENTSNYCSTWGSASGGDPSTKNRTVTISSGMGDIKAVGSITGNSSFADFAEYMESASGEKIKTGMLVSLKEGQKIGLAKDGDMPVGVISETAGIILNAQGFAWKDRFLYDRHGQPIYEDHYDEELEEMTAVIMENPNHDMDEDYIPREARDEWNVVGMKGQIYTNIDATVKEHGFIKAGKNGIATDGTAFGKYWQVMEITTPYNDELGYGIARVII